MSTGETAALILAAGKGTRMNSKLPKALHPVAGRSMVGHVLAALEPLNLARVVVVAGPDMKVLEEAVAPHRTAIQTVQKGTAHAVGAARDALSDIAVDTVLVLYGDTPLIQTDTLQDMLRERADGASIVVLGFRTDDTEGYGRVICDPDGNVNAIVEDRDATPEQKSIDLCNSGVMAIDGRIIFSLIDRVGNDNAKNEYYLTDLIGLARAEGLRCRLVEADADELMGVDSRLALAEAESVWQCARRERALEEGATLVDPDTVWFSYDTVIGRDVTIGPNVVFGPGVTIDDDVVIDAFCHISEATVGRGGHIGPFARLRPGAKLEADVHIGNFVEVKNANLGKGVKANHLSYIGDSDIGAGTNVGAGTITCNYDGYNKHRTVIGKSVFIGSNTALVAPVRIGDGAIIGAGSTVVRDVPGGALTIGRGDQVDLPDRAEPMRERLAAEKKKRAKDNG